MDLTKNKTKRKFWDICSHFAEEYFSYEERQKIKEYFAKKNLYENIDIGGGFESYVSNSCVLDCSISSLKKNRETRKILFDLNEVGKLNLPIKDNTFNSATLIGVFPYLAHPAKVLKNLERIIKPQGKIYIIAHNIKKIEKLKKGPNERKGIERVLIRMSYNFKTENVFDKEIESIEINLN
jgi:hypothetical protein